MWPPVLESPCSGGWGPASWSLLAFLGHLNNARRAGVQRPRRPSETERRRGGPAPPRLLRVWRFTRGVLRSHLHCGPGPQVTPALSFPQLAGGVILGVALWLRHDPQTTSLLYLELGDRPAPNTFYVGEFWGAAGGASTMAQ